MASGIGTLADRGESPPWHIRCRLTYSTQTIPVALVTFEASRSLLGHLHALVTIQGLKQGNLRRQKKKVFDATSTSKHFRETPLLPFGGSVEKMFKMSRPNLNSSSLTLEQRATRETVRTSGFASNASGQKVDVVVWLGNSPWWASSHARASPSTTEDWPSHHCTVSEIGRHFAVLCRVQLSFAQSF